jgi:single-strand selective monofunctional uracil DNA glycosylase
LSAQHERGELLFADGAGIFDPMNRLIELTTRLSDDLTRLGCPASVSHVYNPLAYAAAPYQHYIEQYAGKAEVLLVGMNPGPWGMAQTGVPFGDIEYVRDWLGISGEVGKPAIEHPKRPIQGYACTRKEGSGRRLWGWGKARYQTQQFFVVNYCPLLFYLAEGENLTPDKLPAAARRDLFAICDAALRETVEVLQPHFVLGVGRFAEQRVVASVQGLNVIAGSIPHPSPASPQANRGWAEQVEAKLAALGILTI